MTTATALSQVVGLVVVEAAFAGDFLKLSLPSLLAPGNLPALSSRVRLRIVGDAGAIAALQRSPAMTLAATRLAACFITRPAARTPWAAALADPEIRGMPVLRLDPRVVWSDGALSAIVAELDAGAARVETICLPVAAELLRSGLAERATPPSAAFLARLATREASDPKRRSAARREGEAELYRRLGPSRFAVHTADWDIVAEIAGGRDGAVAFLDDQQRALALRIGRRAAPSRGTLVRQLAASRPACLRFRHRFEFGDGAPVADEVAGLDRDLGELDAAVAAASPRVRLLIAAWTRPYVELFLRLTLRSLMTPGNLPALESGEGRLPATILCLSGDRPQYEQSSAFRAFARQRAIEWHFIDDDIAVLGDAREAVLSAAFRAAMARHWDSRSDLTFLLLKPSHVLADGTLQAVVKHIEDGARAVVVPTPRAELTAVRAAVEQGVRGLSSRSLARAVLDSEVDGRSVRALSDHVAIRRSIGELAYRSARWHPVALRPQHPIRPGRQSLFDSEIVPEFVTQDGGLHRIATSEEALIVDARPMPVRSASELVTVGELGNRIGLWATPWHRHNLAFTYHVIAAERATLDDGPIPELALPPSPAAVPAQRHPAWLSARGLTPIAPAVGETARYQSDLDGYYRAARLAIEAAAADEVIYAGHASHVFAPLLARGFARAYIAAIDHLLADPEAMRDPQRTTLYVLHLDLALFQSLCLTGKADRFFLEPAASGQPVMLIVESPDSHGGMAGLDIILAREWHARIARLADAVGMQARLEPTLIEFFEGHPGFVFYITPKPAPAPALPARGDGAGERATTAAAHATANLV